MLPGSIIVSLLELADNSWLVIYIALLLILSFIFICGQFVGSLSN